MARGAHAPRSVLHAVPKVLETADPLIKIGEKAYSDVHDAVVVSLVLGTGGQVEVSVCVVQEGVC
jgi:hypothetical protein